jgi:leader peptidase (prepilin peptidase)/N-methyltransferase
MAAAVQTALFAGILLAAALCDIRRREIPDSLCVILALAGLIDFSPAKLPGILAALPLLIAAMTKEGSIGGGDIKLTAAAGLTLGFAGCTAGLVIGLAASVLFAGAVWLVQRTHGKSAHIATLPLAPFLAPGFLAAYLIR